MSYIKSQRDLECIILHLFIHKAIQLLKYTPFVQHCNVLACQFRHHSSSAPPYSYSSASYLHLGVGQKVTQLRCKVLQIQATGRQRHGHVACYYCMSPSPSVQLISSRSAHLSNAVHLCQHDHNSQFHYVWRRLI
jgi:hypothetical protein